MQDPILVNGWWMHPDMQQWVHIRNGDASERVTAALDGATAKPTGTFHAYSRDGHYRGEHDTLDAAKTAALAD